MINSVFAQNFVNKVNRQLQFNVNIMNEKGIIIASSVPDRIGDFHIIAYEIIQKNQFIHSIDIVPEGMIGVKSPGVNLLLLDGMEPIGVVGVSGAPREVLPIAKTIKFALESMLEYQNQYMETYHATGEGSKLTYALLQETPFNPSRILKVAGQLGFENEVIRLPIFIGIMGEDVTACVHKILEKYHNTPHQQDILLPIDGQTILYLRTLPELYESMYDVYATEIMDDMRNYLNDKIPGGEYILRFICGIPQTTLLGCRKAYECVSWLNSREHRKDCGMLYLKDYFVEYIVEQSDAGLLTPFFEYYRGLIQKNIDIDMFRTTVNALIESNMRPENAAAMLYMHKNTVVARIKKIKELLGVQPLTDTKDALFLIALFEYMIMHI